MNSFKSAKQRRGYFASLSKSKSRSTIMRTAISDKNKTNQYEKSKIKQSIKEEKKAQKDYKVRSQYSKNPKVKKTFTHILKKRKFTKRN